MIRTAPASLLALAALLAVLAPVGKAAERPACGAGPERVGSEIRGTACDDVIVVPASVRAVDAGPGDDVIVAAPVTAAADCPAGCHLGVGSQTFDGGPGDDVVFGERGNDVLRGGEGADRLFGGIGDDVLLGGPGDDRLAGGFGADSIDGEAGDDRVRGDGTIDRIADTGGGLDTLSYATGVTPSAFGGAVEPGFPDADGERGLRLLLGEGGENANNGIAALGGGVDEVQAGVFERVVGTAFSDLIVGTAAAEEIYGGGGADVIRGEGGADLLAGGADGDNVDGPLAVRDPGRVSVGLMQPGTGEPAAIYAAGSDGDDVLTAAYADGAVTLSLEGAQFDTSAAAEAGCAVAPTSASCPLPAAGLDSVLLAGLEGEDALAAPGFPATAAVVLLGGPGDDELSGGEATEDVLVDGPGSGADLLSALGGDDALLHNGGADDSAGGDGNDLFLSVSICDGRVLDGGPGRDNASWARLPGEPVAASLLSGLSGEVGPGGATVCAAGAPDALIGIEDLEGSAGADSLRGDEGRNQLLGHGGADVYAALGGDDSVLANSADVDAAIDCGEGGADSAIVDLRASFPDPDPVGCERVREAAKNDFRPAEELPPPLGPSPVAQPPPAPDRTPPRTRIEHRPPPRIEVARGPRTVALRFAASEPGASFRCRIDRRPFRACASPRRFRVALGHHVVRVFAIDAAGNRDRTPAVARFAVRRR